MTEPTLSAAPQPALEALRNALNAMACYHHLFLKYLPDHNWRHRLEKDMADVKFTIAAYSAAQQKVPETGWAEKCWQELLDKDDRTSPEEYPDMVLISFDELSAMLAAAPAKPQLPETGGLVGQLREDAGFYRERPAVDHLFRSPSMEEMSKVECVRVAAKFDEAADALTAANVRFETLKAQNDEALAIVRGQADLAHERAEQAERALESKTRVCEALGATVRYHIAMRAQPHGFYYQNLREDDRKEARAQVATIRAETVAVVERYIEHPVGGDAQDTQAAFDAGMNYTTGGCDNAAAILDAIKALTK